MQVKQAVLPVAGLGTRFLPWTKVVPKELLPLGNQPIIAHLVNECIDLGIDDICFVISRGKESIVDYFHPDEELERTLEAKGKLHMLEELSRYHNVRFHSVYQDEQHGDGHAILQASPWVESETIAILFGDDLFAEDDSALKQLVTAYEMLAEDEKGAVLALENVAPEHTVRYGIIEVDHEHESDSRIKRVKGLVEKPEPDVAPSTLGIVGRYLIPRTTFDVLPQVESGHGGEIRLIDALTHQLKDTPIYGYECRGKRLDTGHPGGYEEAVQVFSIG